ncbi:glycoside hydrolase family 3 protein [Agrobacterium vitis]|uniref:glycoside hydrolase family 3 protein n=1 Tax=Rhizobium/Agrobacterium group TaxID=227290 RepID=UPI0008DC1F88|nr:MULTISPECIES: glycoside hydrolase family 3 N-terminal domain-containing protein [Rhizobium/Agrobacterium group]MCF1435802.1 glycoside hydrolase family 3 protein [Allorhizobium ampelinum]MUO90400.1 glycoside hydrolase family 3 protein [Agrobacterium vitis]MUZ52411.1 glycoside hydrolase family 3 protein [Agrobacterium vitis]MUZ91539.1 glycoside hydrolase family 3 protein [Agrobacterium vitis]MVA39627.1 glycoside hydrolase family 3 protein [Agrobacterium vitis]
MKMFSLASCAILMASVAIAQNQPVVVARSAAILTVDGKTFKDLNRNGRLDPYEDWRLTPAERASDLVSQMTLIEKAGLMMHGTAPALASGSEAGQGRGSGYDLERIKPLINDAKVATYITRLSLPPEQLATENNKLQEIAEASRLGIPLTISTDPRNHFQYVLGASAQSGGFSKWPESLGFGALDDAKLTRRFGDIARQEYLAVGIQQALSPQIDLATEPRWPRSTGTFGEDPQISRRMAEAYVAGFQNGTTGLKPGSVSAVAKHWVGYGAAPQGFDGHNSYGRHVVFKAKDFEKHVTPFKGAFAAKVAGIMPTYSIVDGVKLDGKPLEPVAAGYSKQLLTDLLRKRYKFDGVVVSDWLITNDCKDECLNGEKPGDTPIIRPDTFGMPWGVEDLSREDRFAKAVNAGIDQFGGVANSDILVKAVEDKKVSEIRINQSAKRLLIQKFEQGLFENPYADPQKAKAIVGNADFVAEGEKAQARAMVVLQNKGKILPVKPGMKVYLLNVDAATAQERGYQVVTKPEEADFALVRLMAPFERLHPNYFFGARHEEGDLSFKPGNPDYDAVTAIAGKTPIIATVFLSRPSILTNLKDQTKALIGNFGASDEALFNVIEGKQKARGKLPFELPSSMQAVEAQAPSTPHDSKKPLYKIGYSQTY